jgi:hypothetical protein
MKLLRLAKPPKLPSVPERLDRVIVATSSRHVEIPWASRDMLLEHLLRYPSAASIVATFKAVGAIRPVTLTADEEAILHEVVQEWENEVGADNLPPFVLELRDGLKDVLVSYSRGEVEVEWDSRNLLLQRLEAYPAASEIVTTFKTVGASHPIRLTDEQMSMLLDAVDEWLREDGVTRLPPGIFGLRNALEDHKHDVQLQRARAE